MTRQELLKHIGSVEQIGGVKDYTINDGKAKGVRVIEVNTGMLRFMIIPDRCMDIAQTFYKEHAVSWISKTGITAPAFYEKDGKGFLRNFFGGLVATCGLKNIGAPYKDQGLHGRIGNIPAQKVSVYADWEGDEYVMRISGEMRESVAFGENLVIKRTITTKLFSDEFTLEDVVINEGFTEQKTALCYHCNFGYPLVREGAKIINVPEKNSLISKPDSNFQEECIDVKYSDDYVTTGIENGEIGAYITHKTDTLPEYILWKMLRENDYVIGLEPRTAALGGENIEKENKYVTLKPFSEYKTNLKFSFKTLK